MPSESAGGLVLSPLNISGQQSFVGKLLQMALGLFVTTIELPMLSDKAAQNPAIGFDCDFSAPCRWSSLGSTPDRWKLARGEPDTFLWLAATGTMDKPNEPFALIEVRGGQQPDMLASSLITCQKDPSLLSFTFWTIGTVGLEICILNSHDKQINCTGELNSSIQPGKMALKIPPMNDPFKIGIIPNREHGIICVDDIRYDAKYCAEAPVPVVPTVVPPPLPSLIHVNSITKTTTTEDPRSLEKETNNKWKATVLPSKNTTPSSSETSPQILASRGGMSSGAPIVPPPPPLVINPFVVEPILPTLPSPKRIGEEFSTTVSPAPPMFFFSTGGAEASVITLGVKNKQVAISLTPTPRPVTVINLSTKKHSAEDQEGDEEEEEEEEYGSFSKEEKKKKEKPKSKARKKDSSSSSDDADHDREDSREESRGVEIRKEESDSKQTSELEEGGKVEITAPPPPTKVTRKRKKTKKPKTIATTERMSKKKHKTKMAPTVSTRVTKTDFVNTSSSTTTIASSAEEETIEFITHMTGIPNVVFTKAPSTTAPTITSSSTLTTTEPSTTQHHFELLILGNRTRPLFDRRKGKPITSTKDLLCDFANNFPCLWGPETGKWAVVDKGAIPSLEIESDFVEMPTYPAAVALQGNAVLASDPIRCQVGDGKLLFRYWTNGRVSLKVCAIGAYAESSKVQCVEKIANNNALDPTTLAVFEFPNPIREPFTMNIMPHWDRDTRNGYLVIDEIAYIGECHVQNEFISFGNMATSSHGGNNKISDEDEEDDKADISSGVKVKATGSQQSSSSLVKTTTSLIRIDFSTRLQYTTRRSPIVEPEKIIPTKPPQILVPPSEPINRGPKRPLLIRPIDPIPASAESFISGISTGGGNEKQSGSTIISKGGNLNANIISPINPIIRMEHGRNRLSNSVKSSMSLITAVTTKPGTRYPFRPPPPSTARWSGGGVTPPPIVVPRSDKKEKGGDGGSGGTGEGGGGDETMTIYPGIEPFKKKSTTRSSFTIPYTTTQKYGSTTQEPVMNYCRLLNCDFNENACHYLNHGLTKVPWTLRTKGYGFPLSRNTDIRTTPTNGQFVSTVLGPGDFAILESPRFNLTEGINVLLLQYYRPTHSATIRLCLGTRYSKPMRTINAFLQCPPILRSLTSRNNYKWNSVHIQLPPGTTHFYLVAHNLDRSSDKTAIAIDNIRVAICDPRAPLDTGSEEFIKM